MDQPVINGFEYSFADVQVNLFGRILEGITEIKYKVTRDHKNVKGRGNRNVAMTRGGKSFEGSITLFQSEVEAIQRKLNPGQDLTDIPPFPVAVSYAPDDGPLTTDILKNCRFGEMEKSLNLSSDQMLVTLPLVIFDIKYNA